MKTEIKKKTNKNKTTSMKNLSKIKIKRIGKLNNESFHKIEKEWS
jgi:hypothetical protein